MKLLAITYLVTVLLGCCHGRTNNKCSVPTFINSQYLTTHDCYWYSLPPISSGHRVTMKVDVLEGNLTLIWTVTVNGHTKVIDKHNERYVLKDHNKTLVWPEASPGSTIFKVTATNSCGGQATACFIVNYCETCSILPSLSPKPPNEQVVFENLNFTLRSSVEGDSGFSALQWCFVGANGYSVCCTCGDQCSESDWTLIESKNKCDTCEYSCSLTVNPPVSMKYNDGTFFSRVLYLGTNTTLSTTHITVIPNDNAQRTYTIYYITGSAAGVAVIIFLAIGVMCNIKERGYCSYKRHMKLVDHVTQLSNPVEARLSPETSSILEPTTGDFNPCSSSNYGSTDREQHVVLFN